MTDMTILGTGIDIVEIERIKKAIERWGENFLNHVFLEEEVAYCRSHKNSFQHFAARFAAKEAVFKAVSNNPHLSWKDIQIINDQHGRPSCVLKDKNFKNQIHLSISHSDHYAVASAIITTESKRP